MNHSVSKVSIQHFSIITCIYWNYRVFVFLKMWQLFSAAQRCVLRHNIYYSGYISLSTAGMPSQICHWEHTMFSLMKSFLIFSCLLSSRQLTKTFQPFFLGPRVLGEGSVFCFLLVSISGLQLATWLNLCIFWAWFSVQVVGVFCWVSLLPEFWSVCRYRFHLQASRGDLDKERWEKLDADCLSLPFAFSHGGWGSSDKSIGTLPFHLKSTSARVISAFVSQIDPNRADGFCSKRWNVNEERCWVFFYTCWIRGEGLDPRSTGKKTELEGGLFWGQQLPPLLSL